MQWKIIHSQVPKTEKELLEVLLENRGVKTIQEREEFLHPVHPEKRTLKDVGISTIQMKKALELLKKAKEEKWNILVFGDYDCDGICATTVIWETLYEMGYNAMPFIPSREKHGYGLSMRALDDILQADAVVPQLIITVDNGVVAHEPFRRLQEAGIHTLLTDHHQPDSSGYPPADAVIHTTSLCGTTVAWMLARELNQKKAATLLDLCGIATIADQVPLHGANRSFALYGIRALRETTRVGLRFLLDIARVDPTQIDETTINYVIAPRINAMGRIGEAMDALRMICSRKLEQASKYATIVQSMNVNRQQLTSDMVEHAIRLAKDQQQEHIIIVESAEYHEGVIGLVAGKLVEEFSKPAVVISRSGTSAKGSARSLPGINVTEVLRLVQEELLDVGGHPMAAGFSLLPERIKTFTQKIQKLARVIIQKEQLTPTLSVDCLLLPELLTVKTTKTIDNLAPFGSQNTRPSFLLESMKVVEIREVGKLQEHTKISFLTKEGTHFFGMWFGKRAADLQSFLGKQVSCIGEVKLNTWKDKQSVDVRIIDMRE
ncbi:MAG TPA: single-stranded-DNA-specific exonuclease RecJ [Patescibacteria group bacterium]|nr:single-stranded-DNA-specific exonuclease RecJ [Patescibacteria group bacterium]